jgi:hypothetical protein
MTVTISARGGVGCFQLTAITFISRHSDEARPAAEAHQFL